MDINFSQLMTAVFCFLTNVTVCFNTFVPRQGSEEIIEKDIVMDKKMKAMINSVAGNGGRNARDVIRYRQKKWKDAIIPYVIDESVGTSGRNAISFAIDEFHHRTCLWFTPRRDEKDYIRIVSGNGCSSKIGRQGGEQIVSLGPGCNEKFIAIHELMHTIGFFHENSRYDRDQFVKVLWWNIQYGAEKNFLTYHHGRIDTLSMPYDIHSIMHYDNKAFTKNQRDTIQAKDNPHKSLGGKSLTTTDVKQILLLYKCKRPKYRLRQANCKDKNRHGCRHFLANSNLCSRLKSFTYKNCKRTCRFCEPGNKKQEI